MIIYDETTLNLNKKGVLKMLNIIPNVKIMEIKDGFMTKTAIYYNNLNCDERVLAALKMLPYNKLGAKLDICINENDGEGYELYINENDILINADGTAGAFYAIQTLRQIFTHKDIPCLYIKDEPDFKYRGFYHDVTRGKIPTVDTLKKLIDLMAYYKLNSLQIYVEHVFEFKECEELIKSTGYLTADEIKELDAYCKANFIEFIPSLSTFGHMFEILEQEQYKHLRVLCDYQKDCNFWLDRMNHHTINPLSSESIELVKSLIDQYSPLFESDVFNICCDETFDLKNFAKGGQGESELYISFVKKIIEHVISKGKRPMMWADAKLWTDIFANHPELIDLLPEDTLFLNWGYLPNPSEENIIKFSKLNKMFIVCPGTTSWFRFCENVDVEEQNISLMADYGYKHGAIGVLNTNWGDWANPCSIELAMYGMVLGAAKSWTINTAINEEFYGNVNHLLYGNSHGMEYLIKLSRLQDKLLWKALAENYFIVRFNRQGDLNTLTDEEVRIIQKEYKELTDMLSDESFIDSEFKDEMLIAAEGCAVMAELVAKMSKCDFERITDTKQWLGKYRDKWLKKNKLSELEKIEEVFLYCEAL